MSRPDLVPLAREERADLLALLRGLDPDQWNAPSLCERWRVRDVALHVVSYDELTKPQLVAAFLRGRLGVGRVNDVVLRRHGDPDPSVIIELLARNLRPTGLPSGFRGGIALTDGTIHHQDIRRALDLPRTIPPHRLRPVLDFALGAPTLPAKGNARGLTLTAKDLEWSTGSGPEVEGPGEALLMAMAGRPAALADLEGPGLPELRRRVA